MRKLVSWHTSGGVPLTLHQTLKPGAFLHNIYGIHLTSSCSVHAGMGQRWVQAVRLLLCRASRSPTRGDCGGTVGHGEEGHGQVRGPSEIRQHGSVCLHGASLHALHPKTEQLALLCSVLYGGS